MNALLRSSLLILVLTLLAACGSSTPNETKSTPPPPVNKPDTTEPEPEPEPAPKLGIHGNNSAVLNGPQLGFGTTDVSLLRKKVPLTLQKQNPRFELSTSAYVMRSSAESDTPYWLFGVRNISTRAHCFVQLKDVVVRGAEDEVLLEDGTSFVFGSTADLGSDFWTDTCLDAGEQAYFIGIDLDINYADVKSFSVKEFDSTSTNVKVPPTSIKPQSYSVSGSEIILAVQNGDTAAELRNAMYVLLDDADEPLIWGFAFDGSDNPVLGPNEARALRSPNFYGGSANQLHALTNFDIPDTTAALLAPLSAGDRLEQRNLIEQAKLERYNLAE